MADPPPSRDMARSNMAFQPKGKSFRRRKRKGRRKKARDIQPLTTIPSERLNALGLATSFINNSTEPIARPTRVSYTSTFKMSKPSMIKRGKTAPPNAKFFVDMIDDISEGDRDERLTELMEERFTDGLEKLYLRDYVSAKKALHLALTTGIDFLGGAHIMVNLIREKLGDALVQLREWDEACKHYRTALRHLLDKLGRSSEDVARILSSLGCLYHSTGEITLAMQFFDEAVDIQEEFLTFKDASADTKYDAALLYAKWGSYAEAEELFQEAFTSANEEYMASANNAMGNIMSKQGNFNEATKYYEKSLQIQIDKEKKNPFEYIGTLTNLGTAYFNCKEYTKALAQFEIAQAEYERFGDNNGLGIASLWIKIGNTHMMKKKYDMAEKFFRDALELKQSILKNGSHAEILLVRHSLALVCFKRHQYDEGMEILKDIIEKKKDSDDDDDAGNAKIYLDMCQVCLKRGTTPSDREEAKELFNSAKSLLIMSDLSENHPYMRQLNKLQSKLE